MTDDGLTPTQRAFLQSTYHREAFEDMSAVDINRLDMATFARLTGRETLGQAAAGAIETRPPGKPRQPAQTAPAPQDVPDFGAMGMAEYGAVRSKFMLPSSGTGRGIFDATN